MLLFLHLFVNASTFPSSRQPPTAYIIRMATAAAEADKPLHMATAAAEADKPLVEGIIFDLDGTLIDYEGASHIALARPLERRGFAFSWETHARIVGTKPEDWSRVILSECNVPADVLSPEAYVDEYFSEVRALYEGIPAWEGTLSLLTRLQEAGYPMAIATSSPRSSFDKKMQFHAAILTKMGAVVTGDEVCRGKPAPDIFLEAARRLGCDPRRCIVFEDSPHGIEGAHRAGSLAAALPDPRFPTLAPRFDALRPRWVLFGGIGEFDVRGLVRSPPSRRAAALPCGLVGGAAALVARHVRAARHRMDEAVRGAAAAVCGAAACVEAKEGERTTPLPSSCSCGWLAPPNRGGRGAAVAVVVAAAAAIVAVRGGALTRS